MSIAREQLYKKRKSYPELRPYPLKVDDVEAIVVEESDWGNVIECLEIDDPLDNIAALNFLIHISDKYKLEELPKNVFNLLLVKIPYYFSHQDKQLRHISHGFFVALRDHYENYREKMLVLLSSNDVGDRRTALYNFLTYSKRNDVSLLMQYKDDDYAAEQQMAGPYVYEFRNYALSLVELITGKHFDSKVLSKNYEGSMVTWKDWSECVSWWANQKKE